MKLIRHLGIALIACFLAIAFNFQSPSIVSATPGDMFASRTINLGDRSILTDFADRVVIPTYQQLTLILYFLIPMVPPILTTKN